MSCVSYLNNYSEPSGTTAFECNDEVGIVADPEDCSGFYLCDFEGFEHFQCSPGYLFDDTLKVCNFEYDVDCGDRPIPGQTTTTRKSTTTGPTTTGSVQWSLDY